MPEDIDKDSIMEKVAAVGKKNFDLIDKESVNKVLDKWIKIPSDKLYHYIYEKSNKILSSPAVKHTTTGSDLIEHSLNDNFSPPPSSSVLPLKNDDVSNSVVTGLKASWSSVDNISRSAFGYGVSVSKGLFNGTISIFRCPKETLNSIIATTTNACHKLTDKNFYLEFFNSEKFKKPEPSTAAGFLTGSSLVGTGSTTSSNNLSENILLNSKNSSFSDSSSFFSKIYKFLTGCGDFALNSVNNNKNLISSFIIAGLVVNELGIKYSKRQLNNQWNVLSFKEMNKKVVLVLGSMLDPITKVEVEDLLSRGFIVYVASGDVKNSPFNEDFTKRNKSLSMFKKSTDEADDEFDKQSRRSGDILSDSTSEEEEDQVTAKKISDSDWIVSSMECFSNVNATPQDFTRLNYMSSSKKDLAKLGEEIKEKKWELVAIIFSHDNISNNIKTSTEDFKDLILNNMMDLIASLYASISIWPDSKIVLFNNSLSKINEKCNTSVTSGNMPSLEILCNNMVETVYDTLVQSDFNNAYLVEIGLLKDINNKNLNYQFLQKKLLQPVPVKGSDNNSTIYTDFLNPVQNLILDKKISTFFYDRSEKNVLYCGDLSNLNRKLTSYLTNMWVLNFILLRKKLYSVSYTILLSISQLWLTTLMKITNFVSLSKDWISKKGEHLLKSKQD